MARYFFDLTDANGFCRDDSGVELSDFAAARSELIHSLPAMAASAIRQDGDRSDFEMIVRDHTGKAIMNASLSFTLHRL